MNVKKELEKIAAAQRIPLAPEESETFSLQMAQVLEAFDCLDKVNTDGIQPSYHPVSIPAQVRLDEPKQSSAPIDNARRIEKDYLRGPRMMKT